MGKPILIPTFVKEGRVAFVCPICGKQNCTENRAFIQAFCTTCALQPMWIALSQQYRTEEQIRKQMKELMS